ncbi:MAG TPA: O-antigen ligase family protein [Pyrinomonadaceae bacterium]|jgi:O-antigen ligase
MSLRRHSADVRVRFLDPLIYYSLLALLALTAIPYGTVQPWWIAAFECGVFLIAMLAVVDAAINKKPPPKTSLVLPLLALVLFALLQSVAVFRAAGPIGPITAVSADPQGTRSFAVQLFALTLVILLVCRYVSSEDRLRKLVFVIIGIAVISAVFGIVRQHWQQSPGFLLPGLPIGNRSFGQFINRNHFALLLEMSLGLTLGLLAAEAGRNRRLLLLVPLGGLLWVALIFSNSRGGILASLCQLLFLAVLVDPLRHLTARASEGNIRLKKFASGMVVRGVLILVLVGLFSYGVGWIGGEPVVSNFQLATTDFSQQEMQNNTNTSRKEIWLATWQMIKDHPLAGIGFGGYWIGITRYHHASGEITPQQAHNDYLELLASGGLIGAGLVVWFAVIFVSSARRRLRLAQGAYRAACLGALIGIFGAAVHSFVDFGLHVTINALVFCTLIAIVLLKDVERENSPNGDSGQIAGPASGRYLRS